MAKGPAKKPSEVVGKPGGRGARGGGAKSHESGSGELGFGTSRASAGAAPAPGAERPPSLGDILGQEGARRVLERSIAAGRVHHAWVFHGPPGVGKFTTARAFASRLLDPGDGSVASAQARSGAHPDLHVVRKELAAISREPTVRSSKQTTLALDVIREFLLEPAPLAPSLASASPAGKVFIVDEAEMLGPEAQNAMLKTLEEPSPGTVVILVTSAAERLLSTVRSRCQLVAFEPLGPQEMQAWLDRAASAGEPVPADRVARAWLAWFAEGSPGAAEVALRRGLASWAPVRAMLDEAAEGRYQSGLGPAMTKLVDEQAERTVAETKNASKEAANRAWARRMLAFAARHFRERLRESRGGARGGGAGGQGGHGGHAGRGAALRAIDLIEQAERAIAANVRYADVLENLSAQLARPVADEAMSV